MAGSQADLAILLRMRDEASAALRNVQGSLKSLDTAAAASAGHMAKLQSASGGLASALGSPLKAIGSLADGLGKLGMAGAGLGVLKDAAGGLGNALGVGLASEVEQIQASFNAFTKDQAKTAELMDMVRERAAKTPFALNEMAKATASLLPVAKASGVGIEDLVKEAEILAASNPLEGLEGASFALREAMTGDFTSIIERFNLSRSTINKLKAEGVPALEIVRRAMAEMGFDAGLVAAKAETLEGRWSTFLDTIDQLKLKIATPIFDALKDSLVGIQGFLESNMGTFEAWADGVATAVKGGIAAAGQAFTTFGLMVRGLFDLFVNDDWTDDITVAIERMGGSILHGWGAVFVDLTLAAKEGLETVSRIVQDAWGTIQQVFANDWSPHESINPLVNAIGQVAVVVRDQVIPAVQQAIPEILAFGRDVLKTAADLAAWTAESGLLGTALGTLAGAITTVRDLAADLTGFVRENHAAQVVLAGAVGALATAYAAKQAAIVVATAALVAKTAAAVAAAGATGGLTAAITALTVALGANPFGLAVIALGALATAFIYAYNTSETFRTTVEGAFHAVASAAVWMWNNSVGPLGQLRNLLEQAAHAGRQLIAVLDALSDVPALPTIPTRLPQDRIPTRPPQDEPITSTRIEVGATTEGGVTYVDPAVARANGYGMPTQAPPGSSGQGFWHLVDGRWEWVEARARGGSVLPNTPYLVGEHGPELFMPRSWGQVIPHDALRGRSAAGQVPGGVTIQGPIVGEIHMHNEADEERFLQKLERLFVQRLAGSAYTAGDIAPGTLAVALV